MKRYPIILTLVLVCFGVQAQSFKPLSNATGYNYTPAELTQLEEAADSLAAALPSDFQADFKVFDAGFYLLNEKMQGGYPAVFEKFVTQVAAQSKYYLLVGRGVDVDGILKLYVESNVTGTQCYNEQTRFLLLHSIVKLQTQFVGSNMAEIMVQAIQKMKSWSLDIEDCCINRSLDCNKCKTPEEIEAFFTDLGIDYFEGEIEDDPPTFTQNNPSRSYVLKDYGNMIYFDAGSEEWNPGMKNVDLKQEIIQTLNDNDFPLSNCKVIITNDTAFCSDNSAILDEALQTYNSRNYDLVMWIHFSYVNDKTKNPGNKCKIFYFVKYDYEKSIASVKLKCNYTISTDKSLKCMNNTEPSKYLPIINDVFKMNDLPVIEFVKTTIFVPESDPSELSLILGECIHTGETKHLGKTSHYGQVGNIKSRTCVDWIEYYFNKDWKQNYGEAKFTDLPDIANSSFAFISAHELIHQLIFDCTEIEYFGVAPNEFYKNNRECEGHTLKLIPNLMNAESGIYFKHKTGDLANNKLYIPYTYRYYIKKALLMRANNLKFGTSKKNQSTIELLTNPLWNEYFTPKGKYYQKTLNEENWINGLEGCK